MISKTILLKSFLLLHFVFILNNAHTLEPFIEVELAFEGQTMTLLVEAMIFSFDEIGEIHLEVVGLVVLLEYRLRMSCFFFLLSLQHLLRPNRLNVLPLFTDSIEQAILILKFIDFPLVFIDKFFVVFFLQQLLLHRIDYLFKRAEFSLEK